MARKKPPRPRLFGTAGIRGVTNREITPRFALKLAEAYGTHLEPGNVAVVGRDTRFGSEMLQYSVMAGLMAAGVDVVDCGCLPTPALTAYLVETRAQGGMMVTGSHTPMERTGLICIMPDGGYAPDTMAVEIESRYFRKPQRRAERLPAGEIGGYTRSEVAMDIYRSALLKLVDRDLIMKKRRRVLVDPCNGTACGLLASLLHELDCDVIEVNGTPSGEPGREPEPRAFTLKETARLTRRSECDLGVATDIDADRVVFITAAGDVVPEDVTGALFAREAFSKFSPVGGFNKVCVTPVNSSTLIEEVCKPLGVEVHYSRIGQPNIVHDLKETHAAYGYEESGKYFFPMGGFLWCDGVMATLRVLETMNRHGKSLAELAAAFPRRYQRKESVQCPKKMRRKVARNAAAGLKGAAVGGTGKPARVLDIDGCKFIYEDGSWLFIRASGTEPLVRVFAESKDEKLAGELLKAGLEAVRGALPAPPSPSPPRPS